MQQTCSRKYGYKEFSKTVKEIEHEIAKEIIGLKGIINHVLIALISGGMYCWKIPGLGKTRLVKHYQGVGSEL